jgi:cysteinyl-tRNA synthetase
MTIRFFILQSHYRSTLDFSNEALQASEKALKRLWEAYENLLKLDATAFPTTGSDAALNDRVGKLVASFADDMNDDLNSAKVIANMFELAPVINSIKGGQVKTEAVSAATIRLLQQEMKTWLEGIFGLQNPSAAAGSDDNKLNAVMQVLIELRRQARARKDFQTSDAIRNQLAEMGIQLKDEKDGTVSWSY